MEYKFEYRQGKLDHWRWFLYDVTEGEGEDERVLLAIPPDPRGYKNKGDAMRAAEHLAELMDKKNWADKVDLSPWN